MTHPAYLLARLNPKNVRFDVGSGGVPNLTSQDIAAALGMVPPGLGRELICLAWWPAGAMLTAPKLAGLLEQHQRDEWMRREHRMLDALLALSCHQGGDSLRRAQRMYADAHASRWPKWVADPDLGVLAPGYARVRATVFAELTSPGLCPNCQGRGNRHEGTVVTICQPCRGSGRRAVSESWRAESMQLTVMGYRNIWRSVYDWTYTLCTDAMATAGRQLSEACADLN